MFKKNKKFMTGSSIVINQPLSIKKKNGDKLPDFMVKKKDEKLKFGKEKQMEKPNPRLKAKQNLVDDYYTQEKITATQANQFKEHLHHHTKAHIKKMLVEIHRNKKSFNEAHKIAQAIDDKKKKVKK